MSSRADYHIEEVKSKKKKFMKVVKVVVAILICGFPIALMNSIHWSIYLSSSLIIMLFVGLFMPQTSNSMMRSCAIEDAEIRELIHGNSKKDEFMVISRKEFEKLKESRRYNYDDAFAFADCSSFSADSDCSADLGGCD